MNNFKPNYSNFFNITTDDVTIVRPMRTATTSQQMMLVDAESTAPSLAQSVSTTMAPKIPVTVTESGPRPLSPAAIIASQETLSASTAKPPVSNTKKYIFYGLLAIAAIGIGYKVLS